MVVVRDLANDISYDVNWAEYCYFGLKIVKCCAKSREMGKYLKYPYLLIYWYASLPSGSAYLI